MPGKAFVWLAACLRVARSSVSPFWGPRRENGAFRAFWRFGACFGGCGRLFWGLFVPIPDCFRDFAGRPSAPVATEGL